jgi:FG-GAP-like repeat
MALANFSGGAYQSYDGSRIPELVAPDDDWQIRIPATRGSTQRTYSFPTNSVAAVILIPDPNVSPYADQTGVNGVLTHLTFTPSASGSISGPSITVEERTGAFAYSGALATAEATFENDANAAFAPDFILGDADTLLDGSAPPAAVAASLADDAQSYLNLGYRTLYNDAQALIALANEWQTPQYWLDAGSGLFQVSDLDAGFGVNLTTVNGAEATWTVSGSQGAVTVSGYTAVGHGDRGTNTLSYDIVGALTNGELDVASIGGGPGAGGPGAGGPAGSGPGGAGGASSSHATHSLKYSAEGIVLDLPVASDLLFQNTDGRVAIWTMAGTNVAGGGTVNLNPGSAWQAFGFLTGAAFSGSAYNPNLPKILFQNTSGQIAIWNLDGTNVVGGGTVSANPGPNWHAVGTGDFNHDGSLSDILFQNTSGQIAIWDMNGTNVIGGGTVSANPGSAWQAVGTGEFNDDGHSDILLQSTSGQVAIWEMNGNTVIGGGIVSANPGPSWEAIGTGDFNSDGHSDIVFQNTSSGQIGIWDMNGTNVIGGGTVSANPGPSWHAIGTNGGGSNILFQNTSGQIAMWDMNGTNVIGGGTLSANPGPSWHASGLT